MQPDVFEIFFISKTAQVGVVCVSLDNYFSAYTQNGRRFLDNLEKQSQQVDNKNGKVRE